MAPKIYIRVIITLIILNNLCFAQSVVQYVFQADLAFQQKKYMESSKLYVTAINLKADHIENVYYRAAKAFWFVGNQDSAIILLDQAVSNGWNKLDVIMKDSVFVKLHDDSIWVSLLKKWKILIDKNNAYLNRPLMEELFRMENKDQELRKEFHPASDSLYWKMVAEESRKQVERLKEIIKEYGWPGKRMVGEDASRSAWIIVQHADYDVNFQKECKSLIAAAVENNDGSMRDLAYLTDRILVSERKKQVYGTQCFWNDSTERVESQPIEDSQKIDQKRIKIGLGSIFEYLESINKNIPSSKTKQK